MPDLLWIIPVAAALLLLIIGAWVGHGLYDEYGEPKPLNYNCGGSGP